MSLREDLRSEEQLPGPRVRSSATRVSVSANRRAHRLVAGASPRRKTRPISRRRKNSRGSMASSTRSFFSTKKRLSVCRARVVRPFLELSALRVSRSRSRPSTDRNARASSRVLTDERVTRAGGGRRSQEIPSVRELGRVRERLPGEHSSGARDSRPPRQEHIVILTEENRSYAITFFVYDFR
jgi:hypothetical protein